MLWLVQFGRMIEGRYGTLRMGIVVLMTAIISNVAQCTVPIEMGGSSPTIINGVLTSLLGGMSGVVYGTFGFVWMKSQYDRSSGFVVQQSTILILIGWLFLCMFAPQLGFGERSMIGNVANWAHAVGLLVGMGLAFFPMMRK